MCSNSSDVLEPPKSNIVISDTCRKCSDKASVLLQAKFSYCRECFLEYFKHKFRATLGKTKIMKHGDKILIGYSGSASSLCLIDLIADSLKDGKKKKMCFDVNILFINENSILQEDGTNEQIGINIVKDVLKPYNFKLYSTDLGVFLVNDVNLNMDNLYSNSNQINEIKELFSNFKSLTSKADLLLKVRNNILFKVANKMGCQKIFTAETSDHLAINTIANIVQGRGGQLSQDIGFSDIRSDNVTLLRPLQDCSKKEVAYYNVFNSLVPLTSISFSTKGDKYSSIQRLSESFINELQHSFPSTVLTVHATGSKLCSAKSDEGDSQCCLCQGKIDKINSSITAYQASEISSVISNLGPSRFDSKNLIPKNEEDESCLSCSNDSCACLPITDGVTLEKFLKSNLCYGCRLIFKDCKSMESLPKNFIVHLQEKVQFNKMHNEIKTFLL